MSSKTTVILNSILSRQILPPQSWMEVMKFINLSTPDFDTSILHASTNLKNFVQCYAHSKEIFDLKERHVSKILNSSKNFFANNYIMDIFHVCIFCNFTTVNICNYMPTM